MGRLKHYFMFVYPGVRGLGPGRGGAGRGFGGRGAGRGFGGRGSGRF